MKTFSMIPTPPPAVRLVGLGWSGCNDSDLSLMIRYMCRPGWSPRPLAEFSHMFLVFTFDDPGATVIHEALGSEGWCAKPARKAADWLQKAPEEHWIKIEWLDIPEAAAQAIYRESRSWLGTYSYGYRQIAVLAATHTLLGRLLAPFVPQVFSVDVGETEVICSEGAGKLIGTNYPPLDLRRPGEAWSMLSPQDWWDRYQAHLRRRAIARDALETADHGDIPLGV